MDSSSGNLGKHQIIILDWCCMCKRDGETNDHLLLHFLVIQKVWSMVFSLFRVQWVVTKGVLERKVWLVHSGVIWRVIPMVSCGVFGEWGRYFKDVKILFLDLKFLFLKTLFEWINVLGFLYIGTLFEMLDSCIFKCLMLVYLFYFYTPSVHALCLFFIWLIQYLLIKKIEIRLVFEI